jgi:hypothetical protein
MKKIARRATRRAPIKLGRRTPKTCPTAGEGVSDEVHLDDGYKDAQGQGKTTDGAGNDSGRVFEDRSQRCHLFPVLWGSS